jgi:UPF0755 protein
MSDWYSELPQAGESYPAKKKRKRRGVKGWITRIVVVVGFVAFMFGVYTVFNRGHEWLQAKAAETTTSTVLASVKVIISPGMTATQIGQLLEDKGIISSAAAFVDLVDSRGSEEKLQPGTYTLSTKAQLIAIVDSLEKGQSTPTTSNTFTVTIQEGLAASQIGSQLVKAGHVRNAATYIDLSKQPKKFVVPKIGGTEQAVTSLEGLLFPDTYNLMTGDGPTELIGAQLAAFDKKTSSLPWDNAQTLGLTPYQVLIVASILEKEATTDADRATVAAVIYNRLKKKMTLGLDTTVQYAVNKWTQPLTADDLKVDSPYNTRVKKGLPPTPISNPGVASIKAALQPPAVDYLYFIADKDGKMHFTVTYDEFLKLKKSLGG